MYFHDLSVLDQNYPTKKPESVITTVNKTDSRKVMYADT